MSFLPTKSGFDIFDPLDGGGSARGPDMGEMQTWTTEVEEYLNGLVSFNSSRSTITTDTTLADSHHGKTLRMSGAGLDITVGAASAYAEDGHVTWLTNPQSSIAVKVKSSASDFDDFWLWPYQTCKIYKDGSIMMVDRPPVYRPRGGETFYASPSGSVLNDGLDAARPITVQEAIRRIEWYVYHDGAGSTVLCAAGTFTESGISHTFRISGYHVFVIRGNDTADPSATTFECGGSAVIFTVRDWSGVIFRALSFESTGSFAVAISCSQTGISDIHDCWFGDFAGGYHIESTNGGSVGYVTSGTNNKVYGSANYHWRVASGKMIITGPTIDVVGGLTFAFWLLSTVGSAVILAGITFTGAGADTGTVGSKYAATYNGVINGIAGLAAMVPPQYLPGDSVGVTSTGGQAA